MKYAIFGGGAIGSVLASYLTMAGKDVTLITRGAHLEAIRENGYLDLYYAPDDVHHQVPVKAMTEAEYDESPDVIIVTTKSYQLESVYPFLDRVSRQDTVILPLINALDIGKAIREGMTSEAVVAQGEAYVACELVGPGRCKHKLDFFRIVFGPRRGEPPLAAAEAIRQDLVDAGCTAEISDNMLRAAVMKFFRVSALSGAMVYFDTDTGGIVGDPVKPDFLVTLGQELAQIGRAAGAEFDEQWAIDDVVGIAKEVPSDYKTSMMYDYLGNRPLEWRTMFYDVIELGREFGLAMTSYTEVYEKLKADGRAE